MRTFFACIAVMLSLSGCVLLDSFLKPNQGYSVEENARLVGEDTNWSLSGRLSITAAKKAWLTKLDWQHRLGVEFDGVTRRELLIDSLVLSTSLGGTAAKIHYKGGVLYLVDETGALRPSAPGEVREELGFEPPLAHLQYWVRGRTSPSLPITLDTKEVGVEDSSRSFQQEGWAIKLERYHLNKGVWLPGKITVRGRRLTIKLVIDQWA